MNAVRDPWRGRLAAVSILGALIACAEEQVLLPALTADGFEPQTEILIFGPQVGEPERHYVIDLRAGAAPVRFELPEGPRRFEAYLLRASVDDLDVSAGRDTLPMEGLPPVREDYEAFSSSYADGRFVDWIEEEDPVWFGLLRFPGFTPRGCLELGGCLANGECLRPCDVAPVPDPPQAPAAPRFECPAGWASTDRMLIANGESETVQVCEPWAEVSCGSDELQIPGLGCQRFTATCPDDGFSAPGPGPNIFVATGATGGDGTEQNPFGTLAAALAAAPPGASIRLARGVYAVDGQTVTAPVTLNGGCPSAVRIQGNLSVQSATVTLEGLTLEGQLRIEGAAILNGVVAQATNGSAIRVAQGSLRFDKLRVIGGSNAAIQVLEGGTLVGEQLEGTGGGRLLVVSDRGSVRLEDWSLASTVDGAVVRATEGSFVADRGLVVGGGIVAGDTIVRLNDVVVRDAATIAVSTTNGLLAADRLWIDGPRSTAVRSIMGSMRLTDLVVIAAGAHPAPLLGIGTSDNHIERAVIFGTGAAGMNIDGPTTVLDAVFLGLTTAGIAVVESFECDLRRLRLKGIGLLAAWLRSSRCDVSDIEVVRVTTEDCTGGRGLDVSQSTANVDRARFTNIKGTALKVESGELTASNISVNGAFSTEGCGPGVGVGVEIDSSEASISNFDIRQAAQAGVWIRQSHFLAPLASASLGVVAQSNIGLQLELLEFLVEPLLDRVDYADNDVILSEF